MSWANHTSNTERLIIWYVLLKSLNEIEIYGILPNIVVFWEIQLIFIV